MTYRTRKSKVFGSKSESTSSNNPTHELSHNVWLAQKADVTFTKQRKHSDYDITKNTLIIGKHYQARSQKFVMPQRSAIFTIFQQK